MVSQCGEGNPTDGAHVVGKVTEEHRPLGLFLRCISATPHIVSFFASRRHSIPSCCAHRRCSQRAWASLMDHQVDRKPSTQVESQGDTMKTCALERLRSAPGSR